MFTDARAVIGIYAERNPVWADLTPVEYGGSMYFRRYIDMNTVKRFTVKILDGVLVILGPFIELLAIVWVGAVILGWVLYRLVRPAKEENCKSCGYVHTETCPCCSWICPFGDMDRM